MYNVELNFVRSRFNLLYFYIHFSHTVLLRCRALFLFLDLYTDGRAPWTSDQAVAKPLPKHRTDTRTRARAHTPNIHTRSGILTQDHSVRVSEDISCRRPLGYRDRPV
jgi:hypothetical protein